MPKYHFPIVDGTKLEDPVGIELPDTAAARQHAERVAEYVESTRPRKPRTVIAVDDSGEELHRAPVKPREQ